MSTVVGVEVALPPFAGSSSTTAEEMKAYVSTFVTLFCAKSGLSLLNMVDHAHGAYYYLGDSTEQIPILCICNGKGSSNFYNAIFVFRTKANGVIMDGNSSGIFGYVFGINGTKTYYIKYVKTDSHFLFSINENTDNTQPIGLISKIDVSGVQYTNYFNFYSGFLYQSAIPVLSDDALQVKVSFCDMRYLMPRGKEMIFDLFDGAGNQIQGTKVITNRGLPDNTYSRWCQLMIGSQKYIMFTYEGNNTACLIKLD